MFYTKLPNLGHRVKAFSSALITTCPLRRAGGFHYYFIFLSLAKIFTMRNYAIFSLLLTLLVLSSCKQSGQSPEALQRKILANSRKYKDINSASIAIQTLLAIDSVRNAQYRDSLLLIYYGAGAYPQALLLANDLVKEIGREKDTMLLNIMAVSSETIGEFDDALKSYQALYAASGKADQLYQIAAIQFKLKKVDECKQTMAKLLQDPKLKETKVLFTYREGQEQNVALEAAVYNMEGVLNIQDEKYAEAVASFKKALTIEPEFMQAQINLQALSEAAKRK
jgi:tetratricopeptide (TPR) repeat protein